MAVTDISAKIGKLVALSERAATEEEAAAFMAKAQELSTTYQVDLERARLAHSMSGAKPVPEVRRIVLGQPRKMGLSTYVELFNAVASTNNVRITIARDSTWVNAFGFATDIDLTEQLYNSLLTQMVKASNDYIRKGEYKPMSGRTARISFQEAFARRVYRRLHEAKVSTLQTLNTQSAATGVTGAELVLVGRQDEVEKFYAAETSSIRSTWKGNQNRNRSAHGARAGDAAAQRARIGAATAIGGQRTAISA